MGRQLDSLLFLCTNVLLVNHPFPAVELLSEVVQSCSLNEAEIEQQRGVVLRELEEVENNLQDVCLDLLHATAFQGTRMGQSVLGPSSNARQEELHTHIHTIPVGLVLHLN